jgi:hypothetical protein
VSSFTAEDVEEEEQQQEQEEERAGATFATTY